MLTSTPGSAARPIGAAPRARRGLCRKRRGSRFGLLRPQQRDVKPVSTGAPVWLSACDFKISTITWDYCGGTAWQPRMDVTHSANPSRLAKGMSPILGEVPGSFGRGWLGDRRNLKDLVAPRGAGDGRRHDCSAASGPHWLHQNDVLARYHKPDRSWLRHNGGDAVMGRPGATAASETARRRTGRPQGSHSASRIEFPTRVTDSETARRAGSSNWLVARRFCPSEAEAAADARVAKDNH